MSNILPKSSHARKKPPQPPPPAAQSGRLLLRKNASYAGTNSANEVTQPNGVGLTGTRVHEADTVLN